MSFTDDDLRRMKDAVNDPALFPTIWVGDVKALLARLDAAEAFCWRAEEAEPWLTDFKVYKAWKKAAGK